MRPVLERELSSGDVERRSQASTQSGESFPSRYGSELSRISSVLETNDSDLQEALRTFGLTYVNERAVLLTRILALVLCCFGAPVFVSSLEDHERFLFSVAAVLVGGGCFAYSLLFTRWGERAAVWYNTTVFFFGLASLALSGLTQIHLANIVDADDGDISSGFLLDALSVVMLGGALHMAAINAQMDWRWTLLLINLSAAVNCFWAFTFNQEVIDINSQLVSFLLVTGEMYIVGVLVCFQRFRQQRREAVLFVQAFNERAAAVLEHKKQLERKRELYLEGEEAFRICKSVRVGRSSMIRASFKEDVLFREADLVLMNKSGPYQDKKAVVLADARERELVHLLFEDMHNAGDAKWLSSKHLEKVGRLEESTFKTGDQVKILEDGEFKDKHASVMDPSWHGLVRVLIGGAQGGGGANDGVLCFMPSALEEVQDTSLKDITYQVPIAKGQRNLATAPRVMYTNGLGIGPSVSKRRSSMTEAATEAIEGMMSWSASFFLKGGNPDSVLDRTPHKKLNSDIPEFSSYDSQDTENSWMSSTAPNRKLREKMRGLEANYARVHSIAQRIREPDYHLREFFDDCCASFPELRLFCDDSATLSSARTAEDEYQRTLGALFAVYWLLRAEYGDGRLGFCYGVDDEWQVTPLQNRRQSGKHSQLSGSMKKTWTRLHLGSGLGSESRLHALRPGKSTQSDIASSRDVSQGHSQGHLEEGELAAKVLKKPFSHLTNDEKRFSFLQNMEWSMLNNLVSEAGCGRDSANSEERIVALLVLTAFHDIMKLEDLLPVVQGEHAPYCGYAEDVKIRDHDVALSYVLERYPELLPSFTILPPQQQRSIVFTQSKLGFNHGWFVQAEAPPGAMLSNFKLALQDKSCSADIAFYFLHWLTDLAGAEATPLRGAEKFVLKFPHAVLHSFLWSIPYLNKLRDKNEAMVVEEYLEARWSLITNNAPVPHSAEAIAVMRLAVMAQGDNMVVQAFYLLSDKNQKLLAKEMSLTGCSDQCFSTYSGNRTGPAFLVYYGPALLQRNVGNLEELCLAVSVLCKVYRAARKVWPANKKMAGKTVQVQIGVLKESGIKEVISSSRDGPMRLFVLVRHNDLEGTIEKKQPAQINELFEKGTKMHIIDFGVQEDDEFDDEDNDESDEDQFDVCSQASNTELDGCSGDKLPTSESGDYQVLSV